jgi:hypothetical protein
VTGAVMPSREEEFRVVREEIICVEGSLNWAPSQPWDSVVMLWGHPFDTVMPVLSRQDSEFFDDFWGRRAWAIIEVGRWRPGIRLIRRSCPRRTEKIEFLDGHLRVPDDE